MQRGVANFKGKGKEKEHLGRNECALGLFRV